MTNEALALKTTQQIQCLLLSSPTYGDIRTFIIENKPWFAGKDIVAALGYKCINSAIKRNASPTDQRILCRSDLPYTLPIGMKLSGRGLIVINEAALTDLAIRSKKRNASKFRHWLIENLPIIKGPERTDIVVNVDDSDVSDASGVQIFHSPMFGELHGILIDGEPWFVGKDAALALEYSNPSKAIVMHVREKYKTFRMLPVSDSQNGNLVKTALINEFGLYALTFRSKNKKAEEFQDWVFEDVLPTLRKTGSYIMPGMRDKTITLPRTEYEELLLIKDKWNALGEASIQAVAICAEKLKLQETQVKIRETRSQKNTPLQPPLKKILPKPYTMTVGQFAKLLKPAYPLITQNKLFQWLRESGYLSAENAPIQEYVKKGYLQTEERMTPRGVYTKPLITAEGQSYFIRELEKLHSDIKE